MTDGTIMIFIILFSLLFFVFFVFFFYGRHAFARKFLPLPSSGTLQRVVVERLTGFLLFGVIPGTAVFFFLPETSASSLGLGLPGRQWLLPALIFWTVLVIFNGLFGGKPATLKHYPQIRQLPWGKELFLINIITWLLYLAGYEFLFRGLLVFPLLDRFGIAGTVIINTVIYTLAHLHKEKNEVAGSFVFGILLVLMTVYSGSVWLSVMSHLTMALSNDFFCYIARRKLQLSKTGEDA